MDSSLSTERSTSWNSTKSMTFTYNQWLSSGTVPEDWHVENVFAFQKKGPKNSVENYRPISLTSICSKILEHIAYTSISNFLEDRSSLSPHQHRFRTGHSCETQLVQAINDWVKALNHGFRLAVFYFSTEFDTVSRQRLLVKLHYYIIRGHAKECMTSVSSSVTQQCWRSILM